jgi:hypothetical protein
MDFSSTTTGQEILEHTRLEVEDLVDLLNGLLCAGYAEVVPYAESTSAETLHASMFEVNPAYTSELREAMYRQ